MLPNKSFVLINSLVIINLLRIMDTPEVLLLWSENVDSKLLLGANVSMIDWPTCQYTHTQKYGSPRFGYAVKAGFILHTFLFLYSKLVHLVL